MANSIIIFGSNGFIARNFIKKFNGSFKRIYCIDIVDTQINLPANATYLNSSKLSINDIFVKIKGDLISFAINFAWKGTSGPLRNDWITQYGNVQNNIDNLKLCSLLKVSKFLNLGSIMENELFLDVQSENINKNKLYALAKYNDHVLSKIFCDENGMQYVNLIITNTFGVGEDSPRLINTIIDNYINGKNMNFSKCNQLYMFIYIDDLINIIFSLLEKALLNKRYVVGAVTSTPLRDYINEIYMTLNKHTNNYLLPNFNNDMQISLTKKDLDTYNTFNETKYIMQNTFAEGIIKTYEWKKNK